MLSVITTCKNRLPHLKQTLPLMLQQPSAEVIVVDYGCEQGTAAWVKEHYPAAKLVEVKDDPVFSIAKARNAGAKIASHEFLCFVDADVFVHLELGEWLELNRNPNGFYVYPVQKEHELNGFVIVAREHFSKIGGYDEAFWGWGGEDKDLYERLAWIGLSKSQVPQGALSPISHGDELRQLDEDAGGFGGKWETIAMNELYRAIKRDSWQLTGREIEFEKRKELFQHIRMLREKALKQGEDSFEVLINVPMEFEHNKFLKGLRGLSYRIPVGRRMRQ
jgi:glycosyltransferase involved in cell wall biosynthesis